MRAVGQYGCPAVGVHGEDCCVVACQRDLPVTSRSAIVANCLVKVVSHLGILSSF